jgi:hypothetical protein
MPNNYLEIPTGDMDAGSVVIESVMLQLIENQRYFVDQLALTTRYDSINARVFYAGGSFSSYSTVPSIDGFALTIAVNTTPDFIVTMTEDWSAAQSPVITINRMVNTESVLFLNNDAISSAKNILPSSGDIEVTVTGNIQSEGYIDIEIKYDRLGVLPV